MNSPSGDTYCLPPVEIPGYGRLAMSSQKDAPLLVVFGGIDVLESILDPTDKKNAKRTVHSGEYMWRYFDKLQSQFHIFVANSPHVNGALAYRQLLYTLQLQGAAPAITPAAEPSPFSGAGQILYLFSGGYKPGMNLLNRYSHALFSSIYLVDIWMGTRSIQAFYEGLASACAGKTYYVYTSFGANNESARHNISKTLGSSRAIQVTTRRGEQDMQTHMRTNEEAVRKI